VNAWQFLDKHFVGVFGLIVVFLVLGPSFNFKWTRKSKPRAVTEREEQ